MADLAEDLTRSIVNKNKDRLSTLSNADRKAAVTKIYMKAQERVSREGAVDPALTEEIEYFKEETAPEDLESVRRSYLGRIERRAELQQAGVKTGEVPPAGDFERGFGVDPVEALTEGLSQHFNKPVEVFKSGDSILYIDPEDGVVKEAARGGKSIVGEGIPIVGDILGTIAGGVGGGVITKHPAGVVAGEAAGAAVGTSLAEFSRLVIGRAMGAHNLSWEEMAKRSGVKGAEAGGMTLATGGLIAGIKGIKNFVKGGIFTHEEALKHGMTTAEADAVLREVNSILSRVGPQKAAVKGTLYKRGGDVAAGNAEAQVRRNIKHAADFLERDLADQKALTKALDVVAKPQETAGGKIVRDVLEKQTQRRVDEAARIVSRNTTELNKQLSNLSKLNKGAVGKPTRELILKKRVAMETAEDNQWKAARKMGGYDDVAEKYGIDIPPGESIKRFQDILKRRSKTAITKITKGGSSKIFATTEKKKAEQVVKELPRGRIKFKPKEPKPKKSPDLADFNREISDLRAEIRASYKNKQFGTPQIKDMEETLSAMVSDRKKALIKAGREDLIKQIEKAEETSAIFHKTFNRSVVGDLTEKTETGVFKIKDKEFVDKMLKADDEEIEQLLDVIGDNPAVMNMWKQGISDSFKKDVIDKIKPLQGVKLSKEQQKELVGKATSWISKNEDALSKFFTQSEIEGLKKTGRLSALVKKETDQLARIKADAAKRFGRGKLLSLDPDNLVRFVTDNSGSWSRPFSGGVQAATNKIKYVKAITKNYPGAWEGFKAEFSAGLRKELVDPDSGFIRPGDISEWVNKRGDVIKEVMGEAYLKDLTTISKAVNIINRTPKAMSGDEMKAGIIQAIRGGVAPPLTRRGRAFTAMVIFDTKRAHDAMAKALLNPESMKKMAQLAEHKRLTREAVELAASLGMISTYGEE